MKFKTSKCYKSHLTEKSKQNFWLTQYILNLKKNLSKLVNFRAATLILKMEENIQHFQHIMLYYFKKGKNATETPQ